MSEESSLYNRTFFLAFLSQVGFVLANTMMAHYSRWISFLGGGDTQIGWIMGGCAVAGLLARPVIGHWIDACGAKRMWLSGYALFGLGAALNLAISEISIVLYFSRAISVLGASFVFSSSLAYITEFAPEGNRTEAIGVLGCGGFVGIILGPFLGEVILSGQRTTADFQLLFSCVVALMLVPTLLLLPVPDLSSSLKDCRQLRDFFRASFRSWPGAVGIVQGVFGICMAVPFVFMAHIVDEIGSHFSPGFQRSAVTWFFVSYAGWGLVVRLASRGTVESLGRRRVLLAGCLFMALGLFFLSLVDGTSFPECFFVLGALTCGTGHALMFHTSTALFLERFSSENRGAGAALSLMVMDTGMICGAPVLGMIAEHQGYSVLFKSVASLCVFAAATYGWTCIPYWKAQLATRAES